MVGARSARVAVLLLGVLAALLLTALPAAAGPVADPGAGPAQGTLVPACSGLAEGSVVTTSLVLADSRPAPVSARATSDVTLPASAWEVAALRGVDTDPALRLAARECVLPGRLGDGRIDVRVADGVARISVTVETLLAGGGTVAGPWRVGTDPAGGARISLEQYADGSPAARTPWRATLRTGPLRLAGVAPVGVTDDGTGAVEWSLPAPPPAPPGTIGTPVTTAAAATVDVPARVRAVWTLAHPSVGPVVALLRALVLAAPLVLVAVLLARRRFPGAPDRAGRRRIAALLAVPAVFAVVVTLLVRGSIAVSYESSLLAVTLLTGWFVFGAAATTSRRVRLVSAVVYAVGLAATVVPAPDDDGGVASWLRLAGIVVGLAGVAVWCACGAVDWPLRALRRAGVLPPPDAHDARADRCASIARWLRIVLSSALVADLALQIGYLSRFLADDRVPVTTRLPSLTESAGALFVFPGFLSSALLAACPLVVAAGLWWVARSAPDDDGLRVAGTSRAVVVVTFATAVVGLSTLHLGLPVPLAPVVAVVALLAVLRRDDVVALETQLAVGLPWSGRSPLSRFQHELQDRGRAVERLGLRRRHDYDAYDGDEISVGQYRENASRTDLAIRRVRAGGGSTPESGLSVPEPFPLLRAGLMAGPGGTWAANCRAATADARYLAVLPVALYLLVALPRATPADGQLYGLWTIVVGVLAEATFWLVAAAVLGALWAHLRTTTGVAKGIALTAVYALSAGADQLVSGWLGEPTSSGWLFRVWQLLVYLSLLGFWLDVRAVRRPGSDWREVLELYRVRRLRGLSAYAVPLVVALVGVGVQLRDGSGQDALLQLGDVLSGLVPGSR